MAKVEIKPHGGITDILVDGKAVRNIVGYSIHQRVGMVVPHIELELLGHEEEYLFDNAHIQVNISPDNLQSAAKIVRAELLKQDDWYDALIASINGYLRKLPTSEDIQVVARGIANQIIGLEDNPC